MPRQTTGMPYLLKDKQCIQHITRSRIDKKAQAGVQHRNKELDCYLSFNDVKSYSASKAKPTTYNHTDI